MTDPITINLIRPVIKPAIGFKLEQITLREPTGNDLVKAGYPLRLSPNMTTEIDAPSMTRLIGEISGIGESSVKDLCAADWQACCLTTVGFFFPSASERTSSEPISGSPGSGTT